MPEDDTYEVISSILEMGIGIVSCIQPRKHGLKVIFKGKTIRIEESEGSDKYSQKQEYSQKESAYLRHSAIITRKCFDHFSGSNR